MTSYTEEELDELLRNNPDLTVQDNEVVILGRLSASSKGKVDSSKGTNKYRAQRTWSALCNREFTSKAEASRGEELCLLEKAGIISNLRYQVRFILNVKPKVSITLDFAYKERETEHPHYEDVKGILTRDFRTKLCWLKEKYNIEVKLIRKAN